jgi:hypothetical protein
MGNHLGWDSWIAHTLTMQAESLDLLVTAIALKIAASIAIGTQEGMERE